MSKQHVFSGVCESLAEAVYEIGDFVRNHGDKLEQHSISIFIDSIKSELRPSVYFGINVYAQEEIDTKVEESKPITLDQYYKGVYLPLHRKVWTRRLHFLGVLATLFFIIGAILNGSWLALVLAPLIVYPFAWFSHFFIERNRPAAWSRPVWAKLCDLRMCYEMLIGKI
jgi:hypothetical protein